MRKIIIVLGLIVTFLVAQQYLFKWIDKENGREVNQVSLYEI